MDSEKVNFVRVNKSWPWKMRLHHDISKVGGAYYAYKFHAYIFCIFFAYFGIRANAYILHIFAHFCIFMLMHILVYNAYQDIYLAYNSYFRNAYLCIFSFAYLHMNICI